MDIDITHKCGHKGEFKSQLPETLKQTIPDFIKEQQNTNCIDCTNDKITHRYRISEGLHVNVHYNSGTNRYSFKLMDVTRNKVLYEKKGFKSDQMDAFSHIVIAIEQFNAKDFQDIFDNIKIPEQPKTNKIV